MAFPNKKPPLDGCPDRVFSAEGAFLYLVRAGTQPRIWTLTTLDPTMAFKKPKDPRGESCRLYVEILDSPAWRALTWQQRSLYVAISRWRRSLNNGDIEATLSKLKVDGFTSSASLASGLRALQAVGLIAKTREGRFSQGKRICSLYRFTDFRVEAKINPHRDYIAPTNEWKRFSNVAEAKAAITSAHQAAKTGRKRMYPVSRRLSKSASNDGALLRTG